MSYEILAQSHISFERSHISFERVGFCSNDQATFLGFRPISRKVIRTTPLFVRTTL
ncbi:hypothetical protein GIB67_017714, partial [Kingdonia uniflora]